MPQFGSTFSPLGGSYATPMGAAIHKTKETTHPTLEYEEFNFKDWAITQKGISKSLTPFDGNAEHYPTWWSRVKDHLLTCNQAWGRVLELVEQHRSPLTKARLAAIPYVDKAPLELNRISSYL